jgi:hypothetical protein
MNQNPTDNRSRRRFLSLGLLSGAALLTQKAEAMTSITDDEEKVSMLTSDGKLVEVSKKVLEQTTSREKARNEDILKWTDTTKKSMR